MRRLNVILSDPAAEQLDELQRFWQESTGETPSSDVLIQRALEDYHRSYLGAAAGSGLAIKKPAHLSSSATPQRPDRRSKAT